MAAKRVVSPTEIDNLPTPVHKKVARYLVLTGEWAMTSTSSQVYIEEM
jgi:hypothetical protein